MGDDGYFVEFKLGGKHFEGKYREGKITGLLLLLDDLDNHNISYTVKEGFFYGSDFACNKVLTNDELKDLKSLGSGAVSTE